MKFSVIILFWGILFIGSGRSAVLPVSKYTIQSAETTPDKEAGDIIEATASSRSISLESSLDVLPTFIAQSDSESADWHKFLDFDSITSRSEPKDSILSKKKLNSSKYRIRHHPTYLVPVDIEPSRPTNPKPLATSVVSTSVTVAEIAATPLSAMGYQSVIKLGNKMDKENFMHIIALASSQEKIAVDSKTTVFGKPLIPISELPSEEATGKMLPRQLVSIFTLSSPAKPAILSCHKPESIVSIKCLSNFARLKFLSENHSNAKISIKGKNESVKLGHNSVIYIHWWTSDGTLNSRISNILTIDQLRSTCLNCRNLRAHLLLFEGEQGCVLPVTCNSAGSGKVTIDESYKQFANLIEFDLPVISTSLSFQSTEGVEELQDGDRVKSGQHVAVTITGISETFPVGLFVRECRITIANGPSIPLLSNGCSISNLLDNFNLTSTIVNNIEVFSLNSRFTVYNSEKISQPLTFNCRIKVCERKCGSHSSCQLHLANYSSKNSKQRTIREESLSKTVFIDPEESAESEAELLRELHKENEHTDLVDSKPTPENFVSIKRFYSTIFILSCIYTIILIFCVLCMKHYLIRPKVYMNELDEATITTPERCFLNMDKVSARRRSPTQTMVFD